MPSLSRLAGVAAAALLTTGLCAASASAQTPTTLKPLQAHSADLNGVSVVTYYTSEADGHHVVVTAMDSNGSSPLRFTTTLLPGQTSEIALSRGADTDAAAIAITHVGPGVRVEVLGKKLASHELPAQD